MTDERMVKWVVEMVRPLLEMEFQEGVFMVNEVSEQSTTKGWVSDTV